MAVAYSGYSCLPALLRGQSVGAVPHRQRRPTLHQAGVAEVDPLQGGGRSCWRDARAITAEVGGRRRRGVTTYAPGGAIVVGQRKEKEDYCKTRILD
ncbi:hypothetical protein GUJ93_ZPchr0011g27890 [Zizania palustris]|uniref:Uncharacterized protein n=1 Tax=Zizania palustris TaxID=103762 RepID=A0A8J6BR78_ZIZPA|nr:hypothetical protein GUJ93_ZPchr0011g27890 [Zizania palustris]